MSKILIYLSNNIHHHGKENALLADFLFKLIFVSKIKEDSDQAFKYFKLVRERNIGVAGHVSEINLCLTIVLQILY